MLDLVGEQNMQNGILTVETTGALEPQHIVISSIMELSKRLDEFKNLLSDLK